MSLTNQEAESILAPFLKKYFAAIDVDDFDAAGVFYHPDSVLVHKGVKATYSREGVVGALHEFGAAGGKTIKNELSNQQFQGTKDYIIYSSDFASEFATAGKLTGRFMQIWKREGNNYLIYHDEFDIAK